MQSDRERLEILANWHREQAAANLAASRKARGRKQHFHRHLALSDHHADAAGFLARLAKAMPDEPSTFKDQMAEQRVICGNVHPEVGVCNRQAGHDGVHHYVSPRGLHAGIRRRPAHVHNWCQNSNGPIDYCSVCGEERA